MRRDARSRCRLAAQADVVCENFAPGTMARLGLAYDDVSARNPRIVYASTSGFGQTGPDAHKGAVDVIVQAASGLMSITGYPDGPPARVGYSVADMAAGMFMAIGVLGALVERDRSGRGQYVDVSMLDAQLALLEGPLTRYFATGQPPGRLGTRHPLITPFQAFPTADGYVVIAGVKDWTLFCALLEDDGLGTDARFLTDRLRTQHQAELEPLLGAIFRTKTTSAWIEILTPACLVGPLNTIPEIVAAAQPAARDMFVDLPGGETGTVKAVSSPLKYSRTEARPREGADTPGGHTASILHEALGMTDAEIARLVESGVIGTGGPLPPGKAPARPKT